MENCPGISVTYQWALIRGKKYSFNRDNFFQLCASCHQKYDCTDKHRALMSRLRKGKPATPYAYEMMSKSRKGVPISEEQKQAIKNYMTERKIKNGGVMHTKITRKRLSVSNKLFWEKRRLAEALDQGTLTEEEIIILEKKIKELDQAKHKLEQLK